MEPSLFSRSPVGLPRKAFGFGLDLPLTLLIGMLLGGGIAFWSSHSASGMLLGGGIPFWSSIVAPVVVKFVWFLNRLAGISSFVGDVRFDECLATGDRGLRHATERDGFTTVVLEVAGINVTFLYFGFASSSDVSVGFGCLFDVSISPSEQTCC